MNEHCPSLTAPMSSATPMTDVIRDAAKHATTHTVTFYRLRADGEATRFTEVAQSFRQPTKPLDEGMILRVLTQRRNDLARNMSRVQQRQALPSRAPAVTKRKRGSTEAPGFAGALRQSRQDHKPSRRRQDAARIAALHAYNDCRDVGTSALPRHDAHSCCSTCWAARRSAVVGVFGRIEWCSSANVLQAVRSEQTVTCRA